MLNVVSLGELMIEVYWIVKFGYWIVYWRDCIVFIDRLMMVCKLVIFSFFVSKWCCIDIMFVIVKVGNCFSGCDWLFEGEIDMLLLIVLIIIIKKWLGLMYWLLVR